MSKCVFTHTKCGEHAPDDKLQWFRPTRMVDIERLPGKVCVTNGDDTPLTSKYATLSHRWGSSQDTLLTTDSQAELYRGISVTQLSQVFQDAIVVARFLGLRFLWIDCLCIVQEGDKGKDWMIEASRMHLTYQHAYCNISADCGLDEDGLFFERDHSFYSEARIHAHLDAQTDITDWTSVDKDMWLTEVNNSPLNSRGWVFQERMLAPRVIHFCRQEIFWECRESFLCESFPNVLPSAAVFDLGETLALRKLPTELWETSPWMGDCNFPTEDLPYETWDDIVKAYTKCEFTYPSDKLVAISGVAQYTKSVIQDIYLAGMWRKRLSEEMGWWLYPDRDRYILGKEPSFYAPSFSWASVKGQINSSGPFASGILVETECVTMESGPGSEVEDEVFTKDVFGAPLRSPAFQIRVTAKIRSVQMYRRECWKLSLSVSDSKDVQGDDLVSGNSSKAADVELLPWLDFEVLDQDRGNIEAETFYLVFWRHGPEAGDYNMTEAALHCMVVRKVDGECDRFKRIGWTIADEPEMGQLLGDTTMEKLSTTYNEGTGLNTIYLI